MPREKFTAEVRIKGKEHEKRFEFFANDEGHANKLMNDYCASLGIAVDNIDVRRHPDVPDGTARHKWQTPVYDSRGESKMEIEIFALTAAMIASYGWYRQWRACRLANIRRRVRA